MKEYERAHEMPFEIEMQLLRIGRKKGTLRHRLHVTVVIISVALTHIL